MAMNPTVYNQNTSANSVYAGNFTGMLTSASVLGNNVKDASYSEQNILVLGNLFSGEEVFDVSYRAKVQFNLRNPKHRFHLLTWVYQNFDTIEDAQRVFPNYINSRSTQLWFNYKKVQNSFSKWFARQEKRYNGNLSDCYVPLISSESFKGVFVKQPSPLDTIDNFNTTSYCDLTDLTNGLIEILPSWIWILESAQKNVIKTNQGWFFESERDAALFLLFAPHKKSLPFAI